LSEVFFSFAFRFNVGSFSFYATGFFRLGFSSSLLVFSSFISTSGFFELVLSFIFIFEFNRDFGLGLSLGLTPETFEPGFFPLLS
jgi:hypothetical protein